MLLYIQDVSRIYPAGENISAMKVGTGILIGGNVV